jgi:2-keto-4-pentenoate hydratase/2-oxohepta-3-ene-1,7-dioic acid hydratase in catechol pathway
VRLATYVSGGREFWGVVLPHPYENRDWIFNPELVEAWLERYIELRTTAYRVSRPRFGFPRPWPQSLIAFLASGEEGMTALRRLRDFLRSFLEQSDPVLLGLSGRPLEEVKLRAPIPRPRLFWGLVQNSPAFSRNDPERPMVNLFPQGHARPQGAVLGPGDPVVVPDGAESFGFNVELGVVIGAGGCDIPVNEAMQHVAGYTVVIDVAADNFCRYMDEVASEPRTWFDANPCSWACKKTDTMGAMGPWMVTRDEVANVFDLLVWSRQSGCTRDRSSTAAMLIGVERVIHWYSSFAALHPGDVLYMGTMGVDGLVCPEAMRFGPEDWIEAEVERVGVLRCPVVWPSRSEWRNEADQARVVHPSPAVRDIIHAGEERIAHGQSWSAAGVRHFWLLLGNYELCELAEGMPRRPFPRFWNSPGAALADCPAVVNLPPRARSLRVGVELAFVVSRVASRVPVAEAADHILGYVALAAVSDQSFRAELCQPWTPQERGLPEIYGRWPDGFNVVSKPVSCDWSDVRGRMMELEVDGLGSAGGNTHEYALSPPEVLEFITRYITLFPGDVVTLGRIGEVLEIDAARSLEGVTGRAAIEGVGEASFNFADHRRTSQGSERPALKALVCGEHPRGPAKALGG